MFFLLLDLLYHLLAIGLSGKLLAQVLIYHLSGVLRWQHKNVGNTFGERALSETGALGDMLVYQVVILTIKCRFGSQGVNQGGALAGDKGVPPLRFLHG